MMKKSMNYAAIATMLIALSSTSAIFAQSQKIPITTNSDQARELYLKGQDALERIDFNTFFKFNQEALAEDPEFFMPLYTESIIYYYFGNSDKFNEYATKAVHVNAKLSEGEKLMQSAMNALLENPKADVTQYGEKLVKLYPDDWNSFYTLSIYQLFIDDNDQAANSLLEALKVAENPAIIYNQLVYVYLAQKKYDKAKEAADKYQELEPGWANVYDTKGDYYMAVDMYGSAYDQFMKAYLMNADFTSSKKKALKAKKLLNEQCIKEDIIKVMKSYAAAVMASDAEGITKHYLKDPGFAFYGYDNTFNGYQDWVDLINNDLKNTVYSGEFFKDLKVHVLSDKVAAVYSPMEYAVVNKASNEKKSYEGGALYILVKRDGEWKIIHGIGSLKN